MNTWKQRFRRAVKWSVLVGLSAVALSLGVVVYSGWWAFGGTPSGARLERMRRSPQWSGRHFVNPQPMYNDWLGMFSMGSAPDSLTAPNAPLQALEPQWHSPPRSGLRVTWFGHSSMLVELDGHRVLTDPIWSQRAGPVTWAGPTRWSTLPVALAELPKLDAVIISHDHYDHLDAATVAALKDRTTFVVPLGLGAHLEAWGVAPERIVELDWWESTSFGDLTIVATPARHAAGRIIIDDDAKLWAGFALISPTHRVYYSGDTGLFPAMRDIGVKLGPFDLTMIEVGQYGRAWPDWHLGPEQAVRAHQLVRGQVLLPVHWGTFTLAYHGWTEPMERVLAVTQALGLRVLTPRHGQSVEPETATVEPTRWWPSIAWRTGAEDPIVATKMGSP